MSKYLILFVLFLETVSSAHQVIEVPRTDGSKVRFYIETPSKENYPIAFMIHGSTCSSSFPLFNATSSIFIKNGIGIIAVEKYGINETTNLCPRGYLENNTIQNRIQDHSIVVNYLRKNIQHSWNKKLIWAGGSEGGQVAALAAPLFRETAMLVMMGSGGGLTMAEELPIAFERLMKRQGASLKQIQDTKKEIFRYYNLIKADPSPHKEWLSDGKLARNTYKYWNSILWMKAMPYLEKLNVPMLLVHGTEDTSCPIESSAILKNRFNVLGKKNLTYREYQGLEHNWSDLRGVSHSQSVLNDTLSWIFQNLEQ